LAAVVRILSPRVTLSKKILRLRFSGTEEEKALKLGPFYIGRLLRRGRT